MKSDSSKAMKESKQLRVRKKRGLIRTQFYEKPDRAKKAVLIAFGVDEEYQLRELRIAQ